MHAGGVGEDFAELSAFMGAMTASSVNWELGVRLNQSLEVTDGLWELVPLVVASGEAIDDRPAAELADMSPAARGLDDETRARVRGLGDAQLAVMDMAFREQAIDETALASITPAQMTADPFGLAGAFLDVTAYAQQALPAVPALLGLPPQQMLYLRAYLRHAVPSPRTPLLLRALFAAAVGSAEPLVTRLVRLLLFHGNAGRYSSLADPALDKAARELCFGPPSKWRDTFASLGVDGAALVDWDSLGRLWEDRNVIAHRGGVVDVRHSANTGSQPGTVLAPDAGEIQAAIDQVGGARYALVAATWAHLEPGTAGEIARGTAGFIFDSLNTGRWRQALALAEVQVRFANSPEGAGDAAVNRWLAIDMGHGPEPIREEVTTWDISGLPTAHRMARHLLLREDSEGIALLRRLIADGTLTPGDLECPLFTRLHQSGQLADLTGA